ncbi:B3 domain-containing transcription factor VRN1 [Bienertia sinuspersici]
MKPGRNNEERSNPCFFKLMLSPSQFKKLRIPKLFAKIVLRNELINSVATLTVPTGEARKVALVKEDNELWFRDGWQDFVEYFSIHYAYFLMFKYEGKSNFNVHIFDKSACEISYPCNTQNSTSLGHDHELPCHNVINLDVDDDNEEPEMLHKPSDINKKKSKVEVIQIATDDEEEQVNHVKECTPFEFPNWMKKYEGLIKAVTDAGNLLPENPFFLAAIKPYVLHKGNIPKPFGQEHIGHETKVIKLEAYDGRQWKVKCNKDATKYSLRGGWKIFAQEIGLQVDDICVFELIDAKKYVLKVHVTTKKSGIYVAN